MIEYIKEQLNQMVFTDIRSREWSDHIENQSSTFTNKWHHVIENMLKNYEQFPKIYFVFI